MAVVLGAVLTVAYVEGQDARRPSSPWPSQPISVSLWPFQAGSQAQNGAFTVHRVNPWVWEPTSNEANTCRPLTQAPSPMKRRASRRIVAAAAVAPVLAPVEPPEPDEAFRLALRRDRSGIERCYEGELKRQAAFDASIVLSASLSAAGHVAEVRVLESPSRAESVAACIAQRLRKLRLPVLSSEADLVVPFHLRAQRTL